MKELLEKMISDLDNMRTQVNSDIVALLEIQKARDSLIKVHEVVSFQASQAREQTRRGQLAQELNGSQGH